MDTQRQVPLIDDSVERTLLEAAIAAPSIYNSQPWQFVVGSRRIELYADPARQLRVCDGSGRSLLISCGAALFNLRVAAAHLGFHPKVRLLPDDNPILVATIDLDHRHLKRGLLSEFYPAIWCRRTNRQPFSDRMPPPAALSRLGEAVTQENALLRIYDEPEEVQRIVDLLHHAEFEERHDPEGVAERAAWVSAHAREDGIPVESLGPMPEQTNVVFRDLANGGGSSRPTASFEMTPTVAVLSTMHDRPADWVRAGQALQRALLVATDAGLVASFMNQPLEQEELRWQVRSPLVGLGHTQMLMRVGYGVAVPATPRRPLAQVTRRLDATRPTGK
jgi:nitroreductase